MLGTANGRCRALFRGFRGLFRRGGGQQGVRSASLAQPACILAPAGQPRWAASRARFPNCPDPPACPYATVYTLCAASLQQCQHTHVHNRASVHPWGGRPPRPRLAVPRGRRRNSSAGQLCRPAAHSSPSSSCQLCARPLMVPRCSCDLAPQPCMNRSKAQELGGHLHGQVAGLDTGAVSWRSSPARCGGQQTQQHNSGWPMQNGGM